MPTLSDVQRIAQFANPFVQGAVQASGTSKAVGNLTAGANNGIDTINAGAKKAQESLDSTLNNSRGLLQPFQAAGTDALSTLQAGMKLGGGLLDPFSAELEKLYQDPSFQFRLKNGLAAIDAEGNATGTRFSRGTLVDASNYAGQSASQEWGAANARYRQNQQDQINAQMGLVNVGQNAANEGVAANTNYGNSTVNLATGTAKSIADLQTDKASALAAGNVAKANTIDGVINSLTKTLGQQVPGGAPGAPSAPGPQPGDPNFVGPVQPASPVPGDPNFVGPVQSASPQPGDPNFVGPTLAAAAPAAAGLAAGLGGGTAAGIGTTSVVIPGVTDAIGGSLAAGAGGAAAGEAAAGGAAEAGAASAGAAGSGGSMAAISSFLTNPITIGVGAALAAAIIWKKSQVHPTANTFVQGYQKGFEQHLGNVVNQFDNALKSGQLDQATAKQLRDQTAQFIQGFDADIASFRQKGSKERKVADQAKAEMSKDFGPNWEGVLGKMDSEIAGLPAGQAA